MSIRSRIVRGVGFGAVAVATLGFIIPSVVVTVPEQPGAGVRFTPIKVGEFQARPAYAQVRYGRVTAAGVDNTVPVAVPVFAVKVRALAPPVSAAGESSATVTGTRAVLSAPKVAAEASAMAYVAEVAVQVTGGASVAKATGSSYAAPVQMGYSSGAGAARGVVNPSEEELVLLYLSRKDSKHLQKTKKYGSIARI